MSEEIYEKAIDVLYKELKKKIIKHDDASGNKIEFIKNHIKEIFETTYWNFAKRDKYGDIDGDREKISSAIYWILWGENLKNINKNYKYMNFDYEQKNDLVPGEKFSGDTICTFNTLFSRNSIKWFEKQNFKIKIDRTELKDNLLNLSCFTDYELEKINQFRLLYQTLGNFYILPKKTIGNNTSLNSYRGDINNWKDYFDTFLENLKEKLDNHKFINEDFDRLIELNSFFFKNEQVITYNKFIEFFMLEDFIDYKLSEHYNYNMYYVNKAKYHDFALEYIKKSTDCINKRTERMIEALNEKLKLIK